MLSQGFDGCNDFTRHCRLKTKGFSPEGYGVLMIVKRPAQANDGHRRWAQCMIAQCLIAEFVSDRSAGSGKTAADRT